MNDSQIPSLDPTSTGGRWSVDADTPLQSVLERPDTPALLHQTLTGTISWQARNQTPVRRALTSPRIAPRWVAALLALGATVAVEGNAGRAEEVTLEVMLQRKARGTVSALHVPRGDVKWGGAHVARTPTDEPIVAAVAVVETEGSVVAQARVALIGSWSEPVRLAEAPAQLVGGPLDEAHIQQVAAAVEKEVAPRGDFLGSEAYRRAVARVLTRRALEQCLLQEAEYEQRRGL